MSYSEQNLQTLPYFFFFSEVGFSCKIIVAKFENKLENKTKKCPSEPHAES